MTPLGTDDVEAVARLLAALAADPGMVCYREAPVGSAVPYLPTDASLTAAASTLDQVARCPWHRKAMPWNGADLTDVERTRLVRLLGMLGSDFGGERANAAQLASKLLKARELTWDELIAPPKLCHQRSNDMPYWRDDLALCQWYPEHLNSWGSQVHSVAGTATPRPDIEPGGKAGAGRRFAPRSRPRMSGTVMPLTAPFAAAPMPVALIEWRPLQKNTLKGFAAVRIGRALAIKDIAVHRTNGRAWVGLPSKPLLDASGVAKRTDAGKILYVPVLEWLDRAAADRFSESVIAAVEAAHPGATE